ncbi:unnamed protein product, partial [Ascophyllum nodosum]
AEELSKQSGEGRMLLRAVDERKMEPRLIIVRCCQRAIVNKHAYVISVAQCGCGKAWPFSGKNWTTVDGSARASGGGSDLP